jgi:hypothetical protein
MTTVPKSLRWTQWLLRIAIGLTVIVAALVWLGHEFPGWFAGRRSSAEVLADIFQAPVEITDANTREAIKGINKQAVMLFIHSCDLHDDVKDRLCDLVESDHVDRITVPFVYHLYELYGAPITEDEVDVRGIGYDESAESAATDGPGLAMLVRQSPRIRRHVTNAMRLFDALFLRVKPGAENEPVHWRYDEAAYRDIKAIFREVAGEMLGRSDDALNRPDAKQSEYVAAIEEILRDDERLSDFVEFFADFIRDLADNWLQSFVERAERRGHRSQWVEHCIAARRNYAIADYARSQLQRKMAVHIAVDGLQGKLLEGLAQLSQHDSDGSSARYVKRLVDRHRQPLMSPATYPDDERAKLPPLGDDLIELASHPSDRTDFLENFKREVFSPEADAVIVNVATVDTPTISVRNLPIIYSGHAVAGPFGTGIPNFSYLDRRSGRGWYFWGSDVLDFRRIVANRENEVPHSQQRPDCHGARTLFERLWRYNTMSAMPTVDNGALEKISAEVGTAIGEVQRNFIEKAIVLRLKRRAVMEEDLNERRHWLVEHRNVNDSFLGELIYSPLELKTFREHARYVAEHEDEGLPDYLLWYNPWPDHFAHGKGPYSDAIVGRKGEYDRLDWFFGHVVEVYRPYRDRTLFGVVSDHGLIYTPRVVSTEKLLFDAMRQDGIDIKVQKLTHDEGGLPAIHSRDRLRPTRPYDAVVGSTAGGSYIIDLFEVAGTNGDDKAWQQHPDYHQLREHRLLSGQTIDFIAQLQLRLHDVMDLALVREYGPARGEDWPAEVDSVVRIVTADRGDARIVRLRADQKTESQPFRYRYEIFGDRDPLALVDSVRDELIPQDGPKPHEIQARLQACLEAKEGCSDRQWQELLSYTSRPDVIYQFSHLYDCDRAGTINVFPLEHVGFNSGVPGRHAGESFGEKNGTQLYFGAGLKRARIQTARNGSLPVTIYHWLVGDNVFRTAEPQFAASPAEQFGYASLLDDPAFAPLKHGAAFGRNQR